MRNAHRARTVSYHDGIMGDDPNVVDISKPLRPDGRGPGKAGPPRKGWDRAQIEARRIRVEELELAGWSIRGIAAEVGCSRGTVANDIVAIRQARRIEWGSATVEAHRDRELRRLEDQRAELVKILGQASTIDDVVKVHGRLLGTHDRLSKLLGLEAPARVEVSVSTATLADKLDAYLAGHTDATFDS